MYIQSAPLPLIMKFTVTYSEEKDIYNYLNGGWRLNYMKHGRDDLQNHLLRNFSKDFQENLKAAQTEEAATKVIKDLWTKTRLPIFDDNTKLVIKWYEEILNGEQPEIIKLLEKIYSRPFPFPEITVYLTTFPIHPYNFEERWYMCSRTGSVFGLISTTKHELNHFMFYYYFLDELVKRGVSKEKRELLKEALAILTNPEGNDKPAVKGLEEYINSIREKPIEEIIELSLKSQYLQ